LPPDETSSTGRDGHWVAVYARTVGHPITTLTAGRYRSPAGRVGGEGLSAPVTQIAFSRTEIVALEHFLADHDDREQNQLKKCKSTSLTIKLADLQPHRNAENSLTWRRCGRSRLFGRTGLFLSGQLFEQRTKCIQFGTEATPVSGF